MARLLFSLFLVFFLSIFLEKSLGVVSGFDYSKDEQVSSSTLESIHEYLAKINKPAVLTIETPDEIIDCVDIWKQPAFDHPLLKDHKLQLVPPELPKAWRTKGNVEDVKGGQNFPREASQAWHQNGTRCPEGTVPILRVTVEDVLRAGSVQDFQMKPRNTALAALNVTASVSPNDNDATGLPHEYALLETRPGFPVHGATAAINLWQPHIGTEGELSVSQIWLVNGDYESGNLNSIEAGWVVYPKLYGDSKTHLFVYWTADAYKKTGCHNLRCSGFVQFDKNVVVGSILSPISMKSGLQYEATIRIWQDLSTGNWWLIYGPNAIRVGYWPAGLFTTIQESARKVQWGGEVTNKKQDGAHTATQMGSSSFADEGYGRASYFRELSVLDKNNVDIVPTDDTLYTVVDNANCYNLKFHNTPDFFRMHFFYGGPGNNVNCP